MIHLCIPANRAQADTSYAPPNPLDALLLATALIQQEQQQHQEHTAASGSHSSNSSRKRQRSRNRMKLWSGDVVYSQEESWSPSATAAATAASTSPPLRKKPRTTSVDSSSHLEEGYYSDCCRSSACPRHGAPHNTRSASSKRPARSKSPRRFNLASDRVSSSGHDEDNLRVFVLKKRFVERRDKLLFENFELRHGKIKRSY
eukprot:TRINITY_DN3053_c1_g2_i2.p1 TRINITY_DN3053_c1_g2~~TRINITY_DN3053_c1_g2_i2.p1  ORF type:complete len:202 (-),score=25.79 TRINITY_DN3053_c1_g2_i2:78-683(-)